MKSAGSAKSALRCAGAVLIVLSTSCLSVQDFGVASKPGDDSGAPPAPLVPPTSDGTWRWEWVNPAPTGKTLAGIGGTSDSDLWVAGDGGTVSHFDGKVWDIRHLGAATTNYFSVGTRAPNDVWVAGTADGQISVVHFDGKSWVDSYPFAGGAFHSFSHGTGKRLFAVVDWDILELGDDGKWTSTDTSANVVFGPPADVWTSSTGESWTITTGAKLLKLPAGSQTWELQAPLAGVSAQAVGIAMSGAGTQGCAFYTGRPTGAGGGAGFLRYDGAAWHAGPLATDLLTIDTAPHGSRSACLKDGTGILVDGKNVVQASLTSAPSAHSLFDFPNESLGGATSLDGSKAYAVGALGAFMTRSSGATAWTEKGGTVRKDLLAVDVGLDGTVMLADASQPDRSAGGDVLVWNDSALSVPASAGLGPPSIPVGVAVIGQSDAWILDGSNSRVGLNHWTGAWGVTRFVDSQPTLGAQPIAIWAPAANDLWITASEHCPDLDPLPSGACSTPVKGFVWHGDGSTWTALGTDKVFRSIHGTGPKDVWLAGDGVAHWDGSALTLAPSLTGKFNGVWSSAPGRVWLWGDSAPLLFDGTKSVPVKTALNTAADWVVEGIAENSAGEVFVLTKRATGTTLLWFDAAHSQLKEQITSDLELTTIRGRGDQLWATGLGGAALRFAPPALH